MSTEQEQVRKSSFVRRLLVSIVTAMVRAPRLIMVVVAGLLVLSIFVAVTRLTFLTQRNDLVSPDKDYQRRWQQYIAEFGDDDDMVIVVQGDKPARMKQALETLAERMRAQPKHFDRIFYKMDLRPLQNRALLYLPAEQIRQIRDELQGMHLLLEPVGLASADPLIQWLQPAKLPGVDPLFKWKSLTVAQLLLEAQRRAVQSQVNGTLTEEDEQFFRQLGTICTTAAATLDAPGRYRNPWNSVMPVADSRHNMMAEPQYFFSGNKKLAFLLARPAKDLSSFTSAQVSIGELRVLLKKMNTDFPNLQFGLTGLPVLENDEMTASRADTTTASWLAFVGVALLYLLVYRCLRYPLLTLSTLVVGMVLTLGWLTVTVGHLNMLSATFAVMLIGLGDYGVLWITRYEQDRATGMDVTAAIRSTTWHVGPSIVTASLTTALAFFAATFVDFLAVAELGWIAGSGVLFCALACFTFLPALVRLMDRHDAVGPMFTSLKFWDVKNSGGTPTLRRPYWILVGGVFLVAVCAFFLTRVRYDHNLLNLQARDLDSVQWELRLIHQTADASWHALSTTATREEALQRKAQFEKLACVGKVVEVASLIPADQAEKLSLLKDIKHRLRHLPKRGVPMPHYPADILAIRKQIHTIQSQHFFAPGEQQVSMDQFRAGLTALQSGLENTKPNIAKQRLQKFEERMAGDLAEDLHRLRDVSTPRPLTTADLPVSWRERFVGKNGQWLLWVFGQGSLWEFAALEHFVAQLRTVDSEITGKPVSTWEGLRDVQNGFVWACVYAFVAMIVVLLLDFRNAWHTVLALAPLAIGMLLTLGLLGLTGIPLNPANIIALPLILGVGADNGVHIVHDYLSRRRRDRPYTLSRATRRGIFVAALTTILGFGTLMISRHRGLSGLGLVLTIGVSSCLATSLIFLPALLRVLTTASTKPENTNPTSEEPRLRDAA